MSEVRVEFWGTRGSIPSPGPKTLKYGGNTSCVCVRWGDEVLICDAGTGIHLNNMLGEIDLNPPGAPAQPGRRLTSMMAPSVLLRDGRPRLVTQIYNAGEPTNDSDWIFKSAGQARKSLEVAYGPAPESLEKGALAGRFDFVLG